MKRIIRLVVLTLGVFVAARPAAAAGALYLKLPGVVGTVTAQGHEGEIPLLSFSTGVSSPSRRVPGEVCSDLNVLKVLDQTSPILFEDTLFGVDFKTATLTFVESLGGQLVTVFSITLQNASITSVQESGSNERPTESVSLHSTSWTATYFPQNPDATPGQPVSATLHCQ